jgi:hypothetical protein
VQADEQQSPSAVLPSSQSSTPVRSRPSPQTFRWAGDRAGIAVLAIAVVTVFARIDDRVAAR